MDAAEFEALLYKYLRGIRRSMGQLQHHHHDKEHGEANKLTPAQLQLLFTIYQHDMPRISELSKYLEIPDSHVSNMCRKLEKCELIERVRDEGDHRVVHIRVTEKMTKIIEEKDAKLSRSLAGVYQNATGEDLEIIINGLKKLNALLESATDKKGMEQ